MTEPQFANPAAASGLPIQDLDGVLLLVEPFTQEHDVRTDYGPKDPIRGDVTALDGDYTGEVYADTLIFPLVLISQLKTRIGQMVVGRLMQGVAKPGQKPPWKLADPTPADLKVAAAYVAARGQDTFAKPDTTDQPPF